MTWPDVPLWRLVSFVGGGTPSKAVPSYWQGEVPWISPKDMFRAEIDSAEDNITAEAISESATQLIAPGTVLVVVRSGILARTVPIAITRVPAAINQDLKALVPRPELILGDYLRFFLESRVAQILLTCVKRGATVHSIDMARFKAIAVPLPPMREQHRIVDIIRQADELRRQRTAADDLANRILPTLFARMFGDPATNPKNWDHVAVSHFVSSMQGGKNMLTESEEVSSTKYSILKVSAVTSTEYDPSECKPLPPDFEPPDHYLVRAGDLLFSRANTTALVGACAYVFDTPPNRVLPDKIWRFVWREPRMVDPLFIWFLMRHPSVRFELSKLATGTSGSMKNISMEKLLTLRIPIPPIQAQERFGATVRAMHRIDEVRATSRDALSALWNSLLQRAFSGMLTARWRERHIKEIVAEIEQQAKLLSVVSANHLAPA